MSKKFKVFISGLLLLGVCSISKPKAVEAYSYGINITNLNTNQTTTLTSENTGKMRCTRGTLEFDYVWPNGVRNYQKMIFDDHGHHLYDRNGNHLGYYEGVDYDFQAVLNQPSQGGSLWINFYDGDYDMFGPYRVYGSTTFHSPDRKATLRKQKNTYLFINTDDADASIFNFSDIYGGPYKLNGNIKFSGISIDCNCKTGSVAKFIHAKEIVFDGCSIYSSMYNSHVLEFSCIKDAVVTGCNIFNNSLAWENAGNNKDYETIQIESAISPKAFPYCRFASYSKDYTCQNIEISHSNFINIMRAIGNHTSSNCQQGVTVKEVTFTNIFEDAIHFGDSTRVNLAGNVFNNVSGSNVFYGR